MKRWNPKRLIVKLAIAIVLGLGISAAAQNIVDQGQGSTSFSAPWRVSLSGTSGTGTTSALNARTPASTSTTISSNGTSCTTAGGASCTIILASTEIIQWSNVALTIRNSGANAITDVLIEFSPDNSNWEVWDSTTFAALAASGILSMNLAGNARRYIRVEARSASGSSSVVHLTMNDG